MNASRLCMIRGFRLRIDPVFMDLSSWPTKKTMPITNSKLKDCYIIQPELFEDDRGFFARAWSERTFAEQGLPVHFVEANISFNRKKNTLRGMHYQSTPHEQAKLVRCTRGAIFDVALDLRPDSTTYKQWTGIELSEENHLTLFVPAGCAHGFQTLTDSSEVFYLVSKTYAPDHSHGVRWNDPAFGIEWPDADERIMLPRDRDYPSFSG